MEPRPDEPQLRRGISGSAGCLVGGGPRPRRRRRASGAPPRLLALGVGTLGLLGAGLGRHWVLVAQGGAAWCCQRAPASLPSSAPTARSSRLQVSPSLRGERSAIRRRASATSDATVSGAGDAFPAELRSVPGQKVRYLLQENPLLFEDALEREFAELERQRLEEERQQEVVQQEGMDPSLRERVGEVRSGERRRAASELLHLAAHERLRRTGAALARPVSPGAAALELRGALNPGALREGLHSREALEAVEEHLAHSLAPAVGQGVRDEQLLQLPLFTVGQAYATSALFGYVLRRAEQRLQLERMLGTPSGGGRSLQSYIEAAGPGDFQDTMSSLETQLAAEAQVEALFGDLPRLREQLREQLMRVSPRGGQPGDRLREAVQRGEVAAVQVRAGQLRHLLLEATAFGALLHGAEGEAQKLYQLTPAAGSRLDRFGVDTDDAGSPVLPP